MKYHSLSIGSITSKMVHISLFEALKHTSAIREDQNG